jgi:superfamily I DNA and/or RNA helicase
MVAQFDSLKHYQRYFKRLIELERQEEINFHLTEIESISGFSRERKGRALMALSAREFGRGLGGIYVVRLSRDDELPDLEIGVGDLVILSKGKPNGEEAQAVVTEKSKYMISVAYNNPPPDFLRKQKIRLDHLLMILPLKEWTALCPN